MTYLIHHRKGAYRTECQESEREVIERLESTIGGYTTVRLRCLGCGEVSLLAEVVAQTIDANNRSAAPRRNRHHAA